MSTCPGCGAVFHCCMDEAVCGESIATEAPVPATMSATAAGACWCGALPPLMPLPAAGAARGGCYCPACLRARLAARSAGA